MESSEKLDPWNWKMPGREGLMSLTSLDRKRDLVEVKTYQGLRTARTHTKSMFTDDIVGAKSKILVPSTAKKSSLQNTDEAIAGSQPKRLHPVLSRQSSNLSLSTHDIEGSTPNCHKFTTKRKPQNPLNPKYDNDMEFDTDEPLRVVNKPRRMNSARALCSVDDIPGAKPKKAFFRKQAHDQIFSDVTTARRKAGRTTPHNPNNPIYQTRDEKGEIVEFGEILGSTPKKSAPRRRNQDECDNSLNSKDIHLNSAGSSRLGNFHTKLRKDFFKIGKNDDIKGSQPKTFYKKRNTTSHVAVVGPYHQDIIADVKNVPVTTGKKQVIMNKLRLNRLGHFNQTST